MENFKAYIRDFNIKLPKNVQTTQQLARNVSQLNEENDADSSNDTFYSTQTNQNNNNNNPEENDEDEEEGEAENEEDEVEDDE